MKVTKATTTATTTEPPTETCTHERLARGAVADIQRCSRCNVVSVHMGAMTVRFDANGIESLWATLGEALVAMASPHARAAASMGPRGLA